ncbi:MAG: hypothetical protein B7O98_01690 [Zestosphaera tikiterensis]|uniref:DOD-type homing endonuclease domain-containing protein n=1 Tax=Zestosphaera tikiterensis TaxID=1973259 RepID=A0A2R7Y6L2_9CREN|nr:MAG: hypothetical protein B7O98_01690 [Zestosphaera tikiterensis]
MMCEAYLAGLIAADGHINPKDYSITIYTGDLGRAQTIKNMLEKLTCNKVSIRNHNGAYEVTVTDKKLTLKFSTKYMIPIGRKSEQIILPTTNINKRELLEFIAGYFDGDGSIYRRIHRARDGRIRVYYEVKVKSKSLYFLNQLRNLLASYNIVSRVKVYKNMIPYLVVSRKGDVIRFFRIFKPRFKNL